MSFVPDSNGIAICEARNSEGISEMRANVIVNDLTEEFSIWSEHELPIAVGDSVSIICGASSYKYRELNWYKDDILIESGDGMFLMKSFIIASGN